MNIEHPDKKELDFWLTQSTQIALTHLLPLDVLHCMSAGCVIRWVITDGSLDVRVVNHTIVIENDKTKAVIVCEQRSEGLRAKMFHYYGPRKRAGQ